MSASGSGGLNFVLRSWRQLGTPQRAIVAGLTGIFAQLAASWVDAIDALFGFFVDPVVTFTTGIGDVIIAWFGSIAGVLNAGGAASAVGLSPDALGLFSIAGFPLSVLVGGAAVGIMAYLLALPITSDAFPGSFTDIPLIGVNEGEENLED